MPSRAHLISFFLFSFLCSTFSVLAQGERLRLPDVVGSAQTPKRSIQVVSSDSVLERQAQQLFRFHGGFQQTASRPEFVFTLSPTGNAINLVISSGGRDLWSRRFEEPTLIDSLYEAADAAVERTLGLPGFFSSRIAFVSNRTGHSELYTADLLFQSIRQLTRDRNHVLHPEFSPDGNILLYTSYHGSGFPDIYRIDLRNGRRTLFAGAPGTNTGATFDPRGTSIAMTLSFSGNSELYMVDAGGKNLRKLTNTSSLETDPSWSPDGRRIAFTSDAMGKPQIYTMDRSGQQYRRLPTNISRLCSEPAWNPRDPNIIAFTAASAGDFEIALYSFSERKSQIISRGAGDAVGAAWLPDGRHLLYTARTSDSSRIMILDTLTGHRANLSPAEFNRASQVAVGP